MRAFWVAVLVAVAGCSSGVAQVTTSGLPPTGATGGSGGTGSSGSTGSGWTQTVFTDGGAVDLLHFGLTGDTRPPSCGDTADYPAAIINALADDFTRAQVQFVMDLGDHLYVCNNDASVAQQQMALYASAMQRYPFTWFMTLGNHECWHTPCALDSTDHNYQAFMAALAPVSVRPYYSFDVQTRLGLATFVVVADNAWSSDQAAWLEATLARADAATTYTIVLRHHPPGDTSVSTNADGMTTIRNHKFALLLTGHNHQYTHPSSDDGRDLVLGTGGAPLAASWTGGYNGYAVVDQLEDGQLQVSLYDLGATLQDRWTVGPNR